MNDHEHELLGEEHPQSDRFQLVLLIFLLVVWIVDSFILQWYMLNTIPLLVRLGVGVVTVGMGIYLVQEPHRLVIDADEPRLIDWGVYSATRHPMYLGSILIELGIVFTTLSVPALLIWIVIFFMYDRFAAYEENSLIDSIGVEYRDYRKRVRRWGLF
jgi:protein-S-isoprenylcysteine O-methyltransferase Ste14